MDRHSGTFVAKHFCLKTVDFILIVDDYFDRKEYHEIENFLGPAKVFSENTAYFEVQIGSIDKNIFNNLDYYMYDYR